jgi:hypothetical protein
MSWPIADWRPAAFTQEEAAKHQRKKGKIMLPEIDDYSPPSMTTTRPLLGSANVLSAHLGTDCLEWHSATFPARAVGQLFPQSLCPEIFLASRTARLSGGFVFLLVRGESSRSGYEYDSNGEPHRYLLECHDLSPPFEATPLGRQFRTPELCNEVSDLLHAEVLERLRPGPKE